MNEAEIQQMLQWINQYGYFAVFFVTMWEHSGIPLVFAIAVIVAPEAELSRGLIFFYGALGCIASDITYWGFGWSIHRFGYGWARDTKALGESLPEGHKRPLELRFQLLMARWIQKYHDYIETWQGVFQENAGPFVIFARFVAVFGKVVPAAAGYYRYSFPRLLLFSVIGTIPHIGAYYILAMMLHDTIFERQGTVGVVFFVLAGAFLVGNVFLIKRLKKAKEARSHPPA